METSQRTEAVTNLRVWRAISYLNQRKMEKAVIRMVFLSLQWKKGKSSHTLRKQSTGY